MANQVKIKDQIVNVGDVVKVNYLYKEGEKDKHQAFSGIIIAVKGKASSKTFTVRKMTKSKVGVERIFPVESVYIKSISVIKKTTNRKAKIYYIRQKSNREIAQKLYR